jgi:hypothetical protein
MGFCGNWGTAGERQGDRFRVCTLDFSLHSSVVNLTTVRCPPRSWGRKVNGTNVQESLCTSTVGSTTFPALELTIRPCGNFPGSHSGGTPSIRCPQDPGTSSVDTYIWRSVHTAAAPSRPSASVISLENYAPGNRSQPAANRAKS